MDHHQYSHYLHHLSMELGGQIELVVWNVSLSLVTEKTSIVNRIPIAFIIANLPIFAVTLAANIWAMIIINRKEASRVNRFDILYDFVLERSIFLFSG